MVADPSQASAPQPTTTAAPNQVVTATVAAADDSITTAESSELHKIGEELGFMRSEVNALRLEWRDKLSELDSTHSEA